jgi:predicted O-methyltransferase YrrM
MLQKIKNKIHEWNATRELRKYAPLLAKDAEGLNAEQLVELIYSPKWQRFFWIKQVRSEILALTKLVELKKPKYILEIGTANGGSLFLFTKLAHPKATIISIDLPEGRFGGGYPKFKENFYKSFATNKQKMFLLREDSHNPNTYEKVKVLLESQKLDFLFIDGDHSYEGVKTDFELYSPLVKKVGIISFHDIAKHPEEWGVGVDKYWNEIKSSYTSQEFIENTEQKWAGIGVIEQN